MTEKNPLWWKAEVARINSIISKNKDHREAFLYKRVLSYLSISGYSYSNSALRSGQLDQAQRFITIYMLVDPENTDPLYFQAQLFAMKNDSSNALKSLDKAIDLGFNDTGKLQGDTIFSKLRSLPEYQKLIDKIGAKGKR
jgi:hypothetical protein